jgi:hypothetical protein
MFTRIPSATLKQLVKLSERKEELMEKIQAIDREMVRLQSQYELPVSNPERARVTVSGSPSQAASGQRSPKSRRRTKSRRR